MNETTQQRPDQAATPPLAPAAAEPLSSDNRGQPTALRARQPQAPPVDASRARTEQRPLASRPVSADDPWRYELLKSIVRHEELPLVIVDLDILDANLARMKAIAAAREKTLRIATKSIRVPSLIKHVVEAGGSSIKGLMCYSFAEAEFLSTQGFDDLLVAYPSVRRSDLDRLRRMTGAGVHVTAMIDSVEHADALARYWKEHGLSAEPLRVCIDMDVSLRMMGRHVGVQRSPLRSTADLERLLNAIEGRSELKIVGAMAYEAQIAGVPDQIPRSSLRNYLIRWMKMLSVKDVRARRAKIAAAFARRGIEIEFFNGGGTGSLATTAADPTLSEVTVGSGLLQSHLFDHYVDNANRPALCFALQATRVPCRGTITCQSGGFIGSGGTGADKAPIVFRPAGLRPLAAEGFGEVQTPLRVPAHLQTDIAVGDPIFFRPAKAGEFAENFNEYLIKRGDRIIGRAKTYRGLGLRFF